MPIRVQSPSCDANSAWVMGLRARKSLAPKCKAAVLQVPLFSEPEPPPDPPLEPFDPPAPISPPEPQRVAAPPTLPPVPSGQGPGGPGIGVGAVADFALDRVFLS